MKFNKKHLQQMYEDILTKQNIDSFDTYFTEDCTIDINGNVFTNFSYKKRMKKWHEENKSPVHVTLINFFVSEDGTEITDCHISSDRHKLEKERRVFVMQQSKIANGKIHKMIIACYETPNT